MRSAAFSLLITTGALCLAFSSSAGAVFIDSTASPTVITSPDQSMVLHFQPNDTGELNFEFFTNGNKLANAPTPQGFRIIDNSLTTVQFAPSGRADIRYSARVGFSGRAIRAGLRRLGVRASNLRVLRYDRAGARWARVPALRRARFGLQALNAGSGTPDALVWSVTGQTSGVFSVAALRGIPEPASALAAGLALILLGFARTRQRS